MILILLAIFADVLAPYPFDQLSLADRLQVPSARHLLGTDQLGRDLLSRLLFGARISLVVGLAATTLNAVVATLIGGTSGFLGGKLDLAVQRFVDAWMAFPGLLLLLTIMSVAGQGLLQIIVVLGIAGGVGGSRVVGGAVVATKGNDYFLAAKAVGAPTTQILVRHVLPNIVAPLIIIFSINVGGVILAEASLSFLGFGLPIKVPSWGGMLSREGRRFMEQAPHLALWPGLCLTIVVYRFNMLGDAMRYGSLWSASTTRSMPRSGQICGNLCALRSATGLVRMRIGYTYGSTRVCCPRPRLEPPQRVAATGPASCHQGIETAVAGEPAPRGVSTRNEVIGLPRMSRPISTTPTWCSTFWITPSRTAAGQRIRSTPTCASTTASCVICW